MNSLANSPQELEKILQLPDFKIAARKVARYTAKNYREAGFVVYTSKDKKPRISEVIRGSSPGTPLKDEATSISLASLIYMFREDHDKPVMRNDLLMVLHSHPLSSYCPSQTRDHLVPSSADLEVTENIEVHNPGHIQAILVCEDDLSMASILLYRRIHHDQPLVYQQYSPDVYYPKTTMQRALHESGFGYTEVQYDLHDKAYSPDLGESLQALFSQNTLLEA